MDRSIRIRGTFIHAPQLGSLEIFDDHLLATDDKGVITIFEPAASQPELDSCAVLPQGSFIIPNFVDTHLHAPQFLYQGNGLHLPLMEWLNTYAFKAEERLDSDSALARRVYSKLATRLIEHGTGTVLFFGTIKAETNLILAEVMKSAGIRAFVGKLSMDQLSKPSYIETSAQDSLEAANAFIDRCRAVNSVHAHEHLIEPVLTPRFVPTCSDELLVGLGELSEKEGVKIQSHLAEAMDQVEFVRQQRGAEDIDVFDRSKLLTPRTIQAHCTFLDAPSLSRLHDCGTAIAHCPLSNAYFSAAPFPLREALTAGVRVGLGTDIAGGYSLDIMSAMRQAVAVSRMREGARQVKIKASAGEGSQESLAINWIESLYLATKGGAEALGLSTGAFVVGTPFDAQQITLFDSTGNGAGALDFFDIEDASKQAITIEMVEKWWCIGERSNRVGMWVQGAQIVVQN